ncbi:MAG: GntR family transcriptional regulator [Proteobacteria bacterium]|nr:GntR family transcriptional regulator [Pseudomonadota bacterium]
MNAQINNGSGSEALNETTSVRLTEMLRRSIMAGEFEPGARLRIADVAKQFGISHMPVREALRQLEADRIIEIESHKGARIRTVDAEFVGNMYDMRGALEVLLVERCVERASDAELKPLKELERAYVQAVASGDRVAMLAANRAFHSLTYKAARNPEAERIVGQGWELIHAYRVRYGFGRERLKQNIREHKILADAILARDVRAAVAAAKTHCDSARDDMLRCLADEAGSAS